MATEGGAPARVIDFDAFRDEADGTPLVVKVGGSTYNLPPSPPMVVALEALRMQEPPPDDDGPAQRAYAAQQGASAMKVAVGLFGDAMLEELATVHRFSVNDLRRLIDQVMAQYQSQVVPEPTDPTPPPKAAGRKK